MSESFKGAQKDSLISRLGIKPSILLYGRKSINYIENYTEGKVKLNRMEIPLESYESTIEWPRLETLDPHGVDYMLRVFRRERAIK